MFGFLSFFLSPTSVLAPLAALAIGATLGFGGGFLKGHDTAVAKYRVASLQTQVAELEKAAEEKERIIAEDAKSAEAMEAESAALREQIRGYLDATPTPAAACRLSPGQLQFIRDIATR